MTKTSLLGLCAGGVLALAGGSAGAQTLLLTPDITTAPDNAVYNFSTEAFTYGGSSTLFNGNSLTPGGPVTFNATIDHSGNLIGGNFTIDGEIAIGAVTYGNGGPGDPLLTGTLSSLVANASGLNFYFTPTGGDLSGFYTGPGLVIMGIFGFNNFASDFTYHYVQSDVGVAAVPEGGLTALLLGLGMAGLGAFRKFAVARAASI